MYCCIAIYCTVCHAGWRSVSPTHWLHNSPRSLWMHFVQSWFALIACAYKYFCTIHQGPFGCIAYMAGQWELAPPPFYLNTIARGLSYASGREQCRRQLIPEANYLAWVKIMTLRRPLINPQVRLWVIITIQQPPHQFAVVSNHTQPPNSIQNQSSRCNNCPHLRGLVINVINDNDSS